MPMEGKLVILREERSEDMPLMATMQNNLEIQAWGKTLPPDYTEGMYQKRLQAREFSYNPKKGRFIVVSRETGKFAGMISYSNLEPRWSAMIGIMMDKNYWGTGFALDAQEVLLKFLFLELGLRVVRLYTSSSRPRAVGLAKKSGFRISARNRQAAFRAGEVSDTLIMDLLREEYFANHSDLVDNLPKLV
jgi:ribosomal-protein-alanine N-acetyltransferase